MAQLVSTAGETHVTLRWRVTDLASGVRIIGQPQNPGGLPVLLRAHTANPVLDAAMALAGSLHSLGAETGPTGAEANFDRAPRVRHFTVEVPALEITVRSYRGPGCFRFTSEAVAVGEAGQPPPRFIATRRRLRERACQDPGRSHRVVPVSPVRA